MAAKSTEIKDHNRDEMLPQLLASSSQISFSSRQLATVHVVAHTHTNSHTRARESRKAVKEVKRGVVRERKNNCGGGHSMNAKSIRANDIISANV
jgi:hypothetical protein